MSKSAENTQAMLDFMREIWSKGNLEVADRILDPEFNFILAFAHLKDREAFKKLVTTNRVIFEGLTYHVDDDAWDAVADETKGACCWRMTSKHVGTWRDVPASNKDVTIKGITFFKFNDEGKMIEARVQNDVMGLMRQIDGIKLLYNS